MKLLTKKDTRKVEKEAIEDIDSLYRTALYLTMNADQAAALLERTYDKTFKFSHLFREESTIKERLFSIMVKLYKETGGNGKATEPELPETDSYVMVRNEYGDRITNSLSARLLQERSLCFVCNVLAELPSKYRLPYVLIDLEQMPINEAGYVLNVSLEKLMRTIESSREMASKSLWRQLEEIKGSRLADRMTDELPEEAVK